MKITDQMVDEFLILHLGNHNEVGDPHPQYARAEKFKYTSVYSGDATADKWTKICTLSIDKIAGIDAIETCVINMYAGSNDGDVKYGQIVAKVKNSSGTPSTSIKVVNMPVTSVKGVVVTNSETKYAVDIYLKYDNNYRLWAKNEVYRVSNGHGDITYYDWSTPVDALTGTIINSISPKGDWVSPTLLNGAYSGTVPFQYRKSDDGRVEFKGDLVITSTDAICIMPVGYRPAQLYTFSLYCEAGGTGKLQINDVNNGGVAIYGNIGTYRFGYGTIGYNAG
jgi:hypothetical protein